MSFINTVYLCPLPHPQPDRLITISETAPLTLFAILGLTFASSGIFGVMSYRLAQRTRKFGVRLAVGASGHGLVTMIPGEALGTAALGLAAGWAAAYVRTRHLSSLLCDVKPDDPLTLIAVSAVPLTAVVAAGYWPARRAVGVTRWSRCAPNNGPPLARPSLLKYLGWS
ncbi:MAG: hypothetical protein J0H49_06525 [Acidobacteria bacterium]|nr:hypothetical protein [Acidobacteriota bacterium]